jgi:[protein-PII] uridylyltransferase
MDSRAAAADSGPDKPVMSLTGKEGYQKSYEESRLRFLASGEASKVLRDRTAFVDDVVRTTFHATLGLADSEGFALLAVGGYGRKELFPHSDIDLMVLARRAPEGRTKEALSELLKTLWDLGLHVSQSVRSSEECSRVIEGNYELTVSLLDHRYLTGDIELASQMTDRFTQFIRSERRDLTKRMCKMARSRHARFHDTIYRLEPDLKETPGGLRDLQTMHWLDLLRGEPRQRDDEAPHPHAFLYAVRCFLHYWTGRDSNLLSHEAQEAIAAASFSTWREPAEWMRAWFRSASAIWRDTQHALEIAETQERSLLVNFRDWRSRLSNTEFTVSRDLVFLRNPRDLERDRELLLRLFRFVARHGVPLARQTEQRLSAYLLERTGDYSANPPQAAFWQDFLSQPNAVRALRAMASTGFLTAILPQWERIEHLVIPDFCHQYTVDEHTLVTLETIDDLKAAEDAAARPMADLVEESGEDLWLLKLALLLHDTGKGSGLKHSLEAVRMGRDFLARIGLGSAEMETVLFLVEHHLEIPSLLQSRDLEDPATAEALAALVHTEERLRLLTLVSYADVASVNTSSMSPWRLEQFWRLYRKTHRVLTGALSEQRVETPEQAYGSVDCRLEEFLQGLPLRYLWTHTREQAAEHARLQALAAEAGAAVETARRHGAYVVTIVTQDRPFLFASLAGGLASFGLNILRAEAFSNRHGWVVDTFVCMDPMHNLDLNPSELERLRVVMRRVAKGTLRAEDLLKNRVAKPAPARRAAIQPKVTVDQDVSASTTVFEVIAQDRPALLYGLASAISRHDCNIDVVLVDTEAHKAIDVFHVTRNGAKLTAEEAQALRTGLEGACRP